MPDIRRDLTFRGTHGIKVSFEEVLREIFSQDSMDERYRYNPSNEDKTQIKIYRTWPQRLEFYPMIVISTGPWDAGFTVAGSEKEEESQQVVNGVLVSEMFTGSMTIPVTFKIFSKRVDDTERLTDIMVIILRILNRGNFASYGIGYNKIRVNGEGQFSEASGETIFTNSLTIEVHTDYTHLFRVDQDGLINKILLRVFGKEHPDSVPFLLAPLEVPGPFPP